MSLQTQVHVLGGLREGRAVFQQVVAHDDHRDTRGAGIFLRACIDQAVARNIEWLRKKAARDVGKKGSVAAFGQLVEHGAKDGVVLADVDVIKVACGRALAHGGERGDTVEIGAFA